MNDEVSSNDSTYEPIKSAADAGYAYLLKSSSDSGWGLFAGDANDPLYSSLAIAALRGVEAAAPIITSTFRTTFLDKYQNTNFGELPLDTLLSIVRAAANSLDIIEGEPRSFDSVNPPSIDAHKRCLRRAAKALHGKIDALANELQPNPKTVAQVLLVEALYLPSRANDEGVVRLWERLTEIQNTTEGWWGSLDPPRSDVIATALSCLAIRKAGKQHLMSATVVGEDYLLELVRARGWRGLADGTDAYSRSVLLRAFASCGRAAPELGQGVAELIEQQTDDGSWVSGGRSSVEATAHALIALREVLESRGAGLEVEVREIEDSSTTDLARNEETPARISDSGEAAAPVADEVARLQALQVSQLQFLERLADLTERQERSSVVRNAVSLSPRERRLANYIFVAGLILAAVGMASLVLSATRGVNTAYATIVAMLATLLFSAIIVFTFQRASVIRRGYYRSVASPSFEPFFRLMAIDPEGARRLLEFVTKRMVSLPEDIFKDQVYSTARLAGVASFAENEAISWLRVMASLGRDERVDMIRALDDFLNTV